MAFRVWKLCVTFEKQAPGLFRIPLLTAFCHGPASLYSYGGFKEAGDDWALILYRNLLAHFKQMKGKAFSAACSLLWGSETSISHQSRQRYTTVRIGLLSYNLNKMFSVRMFFSYQ